MTTPENMQVPEEIARLAEIMRDEGVRSLLEIGSKFGHSLDILARAMPKGSRVVSVDLPFGTRLWKESGPALDGVVAGLVRDGYDAHVIWGNSADRHVIDRVRALGPFVAIFIDADHRMAGVMNDWRNYGPMGRIVAFHDIAWKRAPEWQGVRIDVPQLWNAIKNRHRHEEIVRCPTGKNNGIGVLWR